jgi:YHS domain-containing protein
MPLTANDLLSVGRRSICGRDRRKVTTLCRPESKRLGVRSRRAVLHAKTIAGPERCLERPRAKSCAGWTFRETAGLVVDPVCGMEIDPTEARHQLSVDGATRWFCCEGCRDEFQRERARAGT